MSAETMSINGGRTGSSDLLLDGVSNTGTEGSSAANMGFVPTPETVSEFKHPDQQLRRAVWPHLGRHHDRQHQERHQQPSRRRLLVGQEHHPHRQHLRPEPHRPPRAAYHQNNPGFEFDGPVVIPHLYNGHNRTFFMYGYEIWRDSIPTPAT